MRKGVTKKHKEIFGGDGYVHFHYEDSFMGPTCQIAHFKYTYFILCLLFFNKAN